MTNRCLIVGIDNYTFEPLSSAVNDALSVREKLIETGVFHTAEIDVLASPLPESHHNLPENTKAATSAAILNYFKNLYQAAQPHDRFLFYFAGHGISARRGSAQATLSTVIVPVDINSIENDGRLLIDLDDLRMRFRMRGPFEQFYIVDACRDIGCERNPDVGGAGFAAMNDDAPRRQATLFAVAPLGQALGRAGELGVMTGHLLHALDGKGCALDWVVRNNRRTPAVTIQSVRDYVRRRVEEQLAGFPLWKLIFNLPTLEDPDPKTDPLRFIKAPATANLIVSVEPKAAESAVEATLEIFGCTAGRWPPFGTSITAQPTIYELSARLIGDTDLWLEPDPAIRVVDAREISSVVLYVSPQLQPPGIVPPPPIVETIATLSPRSSAQALLFKPVALQTSIELGSGQTDEVKLAQFLLHKVGVRKPRVDGIFGPITQEIVRDFQQSVEVPVTGTIDSVTWGALLNESYTITTDKFQFDIKMPRAKRPSVICDLPGRTIAFPKRGVAIGSRRTDVVKAVQYVANIAGIVPLSVDGDFGEITESAVRVFQKQAALAPTGKVDDATWQAMVDTASSRPALLKIQSVDPNVIVRIEAMAGTREIYEISNDSEISVPAGPYHVEVMLGGDLLNKTDLVLMPGQSRTIQTVAEQGEATTQLLSGVATPGRTAYQPSEAIGLIQGAVLPTLLPLIALKYFDCSNDILSHLNICVPALPPATDPSGYVAIAMALEGQWKESPAQVWQQVHVNWRTLGGPSQLESGGNFSAMSPISERVSTAFAKPGLGSCQVIVTVPELMELDIASCTTLRRATCIGLVLHADGRIRLTQSLLLPPGVEPELENRTIKPQRVARLLALAASIYADGSHSRTLTHPELVELEYGKWTDPLLGVLAWLSRNGLYGSPSWGVPKTDTDEVANNLARFFAGVPDVSVIQALRGHSDWSNLISNPSVSPLFAATARILSAEAIRRNRQDSPIVDRSRRLSSDSIWNVVVKPAASKVKNQENNHAEFPAK